MSELREYKRNGLTCQFSELSLSPTDEFSGRRRIYKLNKPFSFNLSFKGGWETIDIPKGFKTDFASIPLVAVWFIGAPSDYPEESIIHDRLCSLDLPYFACNAKLRIVQEILGRPKWKQLGMYFAVMLFGYKSPLQKIVRRFVRKVVRVVI